MPNFRIAEHDLFDYNKGFLFGISLTKDGIDHISGNDLIRHPLSHLTLWVQWVVDDYKGQYYDFDLGKWVDCDKE